MSHLVRLLNMCIEMLETGEVHTFRTWDHDLLMDIKTGKYMNAEGNISDEFYKLVAELEERFNKAKENSKKKQESVLFLDDKDNPENNESILRIRCENKNKNYTLFIFISVKIPTKFIKYEKFISK